MAAAVWLTLSAIKPIEVASINEQIRLGEELDGESDDKLDVVNDVSNIIASLII